MSLRDFHLLFLDEMTRIEMNAWIFYLQNIRNNYRRANVQILMMKEMYIIRAYVEMGNEKFEIIIENVISISLRARVTLF